MRLIDKRKPESLVANLYAEEPESATLAYRTLGVTMSFRSGKSSLRAIALSMFASVLLLSVVRHAAAAEAKALQSEFDIEVYSQKGVTTGCGLSFLAGWLNSDQQVIAAAGTLNFFAADTTSIGSTVKVRATIGNQAKELTFAWVEVPGTGNTKAFSPLVANQTGPFYSFFGKPDAQGLSRLVAAAQNGFLVGLTISGLPLDETVRLPAAPHDVLAKLNTCARSVATRLHSMKAK